MKPYHYSRQKRPLQWDNKGYTIDQTILIVAIISILITLVIITVGWTLLGRTTGTKLTTQVKDIEHSISEFFVTYGEWPTRSYTGTMTMQDSAMALKGSTSGLTFTAAVLAKGDGSVKDLLQGLQIKNGALRHGFSNTAATGTTDGPSIYLREVTNPTALYPGTYNMILMDDVPYNAAKVLEQEIDGDIDFSNGKVIMGTGGTGCNYGTASNLPASPDSNQLVDLCYLSTRIN
jgi:hypothetical protein